MGAIKLDVSDGGAWPEMNDQNTVDMAESTLEVAWVSKPEGKENDPTAQSIVAFKFTIPNATDEKRYIFWSGELNKLIDAIKVLDTISKEKK